jgi:hypothetical protein
VLNKEKAWCFAPRLFFVAENIEISNQTISDFIDIVELMGEIAIEMVDS